MKAIMFWDTSRPLTLEELPPPDPRSDEILLQVRRCGICGSDVHLTREPGYFPEKVVLGHEFAGEVIAVGRDVSGFRVGDTVSAVPGAGCGKCIGCRTAGPFHCELGPRFTAGGFAQYAAVAATSTIRLPATLSMSDGALIEPLAVSLHGVRLGNIGPGSRVLVLGPGSVGLGCIHWARKRGAARIVATSRSTRRAELAGRMGADAFVEAGEDLAGRVSEALGGPPDVVFECVGAVGALTQAIALVRPFGTVVSLGFCTRPDSLVPALATMKQATLIFSSNCSLADFQHAADMFDRGHVEPRQMLGRVIPIEAVPGTIEALRDGSGENKIQIDPWMAQPIA